MTTERRIPLFFALLLYGSMAIAAMIWIRFGGVHSLADLLLWHGYVVPAIVGLGAGLTLAATAAAMSVTLTAFRDLEIEFSRFCADQRGFEIVILAALSATAEELFFRGAMQQRLIITAGGWTDEGAAAIGIVLTSVVFGLFHIPFSRRLLTWPALAAGSGIVLGYLLHWTHSLLAPIVAHMVVNAVGFWRISRRYGTPRYEFE